MSDKHRREILLSELTFVRIVCKHMVNGRDEAKACDAVIEVPLDKLASVKKCPLCENLLKPVVDVATGEKEPFSQFVKALASLQKLNAVEISFVLPGGELVNG